MDSAKNSRASISRKGERFWRSNAAMPVRLLALSLAQGIGNVWWILLCYNFISHRTCSDYISRSLQALSWLPQVIEP